MVDPSYLSIVQASSVVQALQKAYRSANKERKSRKATETGPVQVKAAITESGIVKARSRPIQFMEDEDEVVEMKSIAGGRRDSKKAIPAIIVSWGVAGPTAFLIWTSYL